MVVYCTLHLAPCSEVDYPAPLGTLKMGCLRVQPSLAVPVFKGFGNAMRLCGFVDVGLAWHRPGLDYMWVQGRFDWRGQLEPA